MITNLFTLTEKLESLKTPCVIQNELTFAEFKEWCNLDRYGNNNPGELPTHRLCRGWVVHKIAFGGFVKPVLMYYGQ